jgi:hypothetical protein
MLCVPRFAPVAGDLPPGQGDAQDRHALLPGLARAESATRGPIVRVATTLVCPFMDVQSCTVLYCIGAMSWEWGRARGLPGPTEMFSN